MITPSGLQTPVFCPYNCAQRTWSAIRLPLRTTAPHATRSGCRRRRRSSLRRAASSWQRRPPSHAAARSWRRWSASSRRRAARWRRRRSGAPRRRLWRRSARAAPARGACIPKCDTYQCASQRASFGLAEQRLFITSLGVLPPFNLSPLKAIDRMAHTNVGTWLQVAQARRRGGGRACAHHAAGRAAERGDRRARRRRGCAGRRRRRASPRNAAARGIAREQGARLLCCSAHAVSCPLASQYIFPVLRGPV